MRQARATLTYGSPILCDGVVNSGVEAARQGEMGADFTLLIMRNKSLLRTPFFVLYHYGELENA